jgi:hypothetical protein
MIRRLFLKAAQPGRVIPVAGNITLWDILIPAGIFYVLLKIRVVLVKK